MPNYIKIRVFDLTASDYELFPEQINLFAQQAFNDQFSKYNDLTYLESAEAGQLTPGDLVEVPYGKQPTRIGVYLEPDHGKIDLAIHYRPIIRRLGNVTVDKVKESAIHEG